MHRFSSTSLAALFGCGLLVIASGAFAQAAEAVGALRWVHGSVPKPSTLFGVTDDKKLHELMRGAPNATTKASGWSLNLVLERPVARELVWAYDLTDPMPLTYTREGWLLNAPEKRTVRMYYHIGFDREGKAVAAAQWYHGPASAARDSGRTGVAVRESSPITYWNYELGATLRGFTNQDEARMRVSHWPAPFGAQSETPGKIHDWRDKIEHGQVLRVQPSRESASGLNGYLLLEGVNCFAVGRAYGVLPDEGGPVGRYSFIKGWPCISVVNVVVSWLPGYRPVRANIVPSTDDRAKILPGVK